MRAEQSLDEYVEHCDHQSEGGRCPQTKEAILDLAHAGNAGELLFGGRVVAESVLPDVLAGSLSSK